MTVQSMDKEALTKAMKYMGEFGWPTVVLALLTCGGFIATPLLVLHGYLPLVVGVLLMAACTYGSYTVMHDSVHGAIAGKHTQWRWLNNALGYLSGFVIGAPFSAHRHEHITHHRHTNDAKLDPDYQISGMGQSPLKAIRSAWQMVLANYTYYRNVRWQRAPAAERFIFVGEVLCANAARVACLFLFKDVWWEAVLLLLVGPSLGVVLLIYLFAYIVHHPHTQIGRYVDTSTIEVPGVWGGILTWAWLSQNYHSIHHLFPKVPFYRYRALFNDIEPIMRARGAPIYRLTWAGLEASETEPAQCNQAL